MRRHGRVGEVGRTDMRGIGSKLASRVTEDALKEQ